jgi:hypothetical protein
VWLCDAAAVEGARTGGGSRPVRLVHGMRTTIRVSGVDRRTPASITAVSSFDDLADWAWRLPRRVRRRSSQPR